MPPKSRRRPSSAVASSVVPSPRAPQPYILPSREWDRATELIRMFAATGWCANERPQSLMLIAEPGSGKTELLERFIVNPWLDFESDLTVRGLYAILKRARAGGVTHLVATEFQKYFMRKSATADNMLGTLCQAMEEGVKNVQIGETSHNFGGAQLGFLGAFTPETFKDKKRLLQQTGFLSRAAVLEWGMSSEEVYAVMESINNGDRSDLRPVVVGVPDKKVRVELPAPLSKQFQEYVWKRFRDHTVLRLFNRFRTLAMACAVLDNRDVVHARDVEKVVAFDPYWTGLWRG